MAGCGRYDRVDRSTPIHLANTKPSKTDTTGTMDTFTAFMPRIMIVSLVLIFVVAGAHGQTWDETTDGGGDAGELVSSSQGITSSGSLTTITGSIGVTNDVDMYRIIVTTGASFSASTVGQADIDTQLSLVSATGMAVYLNDDSTGVLGSKLPAGDTFSPSTNGDVYYLIVGNYNNHPQDVSGNPIFTYNGTADYELINGPSVNPGPVAQYQQLGTETGAYTVTLTSAEGDPTLPVELASFSAVLDEADVVLQWKTLSEQNNQGYDVQVMGTANGDFLSIGFVEGNGTTTEATNYSFRATELDFGTQTFRLRQVDHDGSFQYSSEVEVSVELPTEFVMNAAYPNPFNPQATFEFAVQDAQQVSASLYNMVGQRVAELFNGVVEANSLKQVSIDGGALPSGIYIVRLNGQTFESTQTISLLK